MTGECVRCLLLLLLLVVVVRLPLALMPFDGEYL